MENELGDSNGLYSNNEDEMNSSEEKDNPYEDEEDDSSLFAALEMEPYLFEHITAIDQSGAESALEEDRGEAI